MTEIEADPPVDAPPAAEAAESTAPPQVAWIWGTGRRKRAIARVRIRPGDGKFLIN